MQTSQKNGKKVSIGFGKRIGKALRREAVYVRSTRVKSWAALTTTNTFLVVREPLPVHDHDKTPLCRNDPDRDGSAIALSRNRCQGRRWLGVSPE